MAIKRTKIAKDNRNTPYDLDLSGEVDSQGRLPELWGKDALNNAIILWATSQKGEQPRRGNRGGVLFQYINKNMNDVVAKNIEQSLRDGIQTDFNNDLTIQFLKVTPLYEKKQWEIKMQVISTRLKLLTDLSFVVQSS